MVQKGSSVALWQNNSALPCALTSSSASLPRVCRGSLTILNARLTFPSRVLFCGCLWQVGVWSEGRAWGVFSWPLIRQDSSYHLPSIWVFEPAIKPWHLQLSSPHITAFSPSDHSLYSRTLWSSPSPSPWPILLYLDLVFKSGLPKEDCKPISNRNYVRLLCSIPWTWAVLNKCCSGNEESIIRGPRQQLAMGITWT